MAVEDLARLASMARHAARLYARERSSLPLRLIAGVSSSLLWCLIACCCWQLLLSRVTRSLDPLVSASYPTYIHTAL